MRFAGHCWWAKQELADDLLLWSPNYGKRGVGHPTINYIDQLCGHTECLPNDLPALLQDRDGWLHRLMNAWASLHVGSNPVTFYWFKGQLKDIHWHFKSKYLYQHCLSSKLISTIHVTLSWKTNGTQDTIFQTEFLQLIISMVTCSYWNIFQTESNMF